MRVEIALKEKRLLTMKEFCAYTSFGPSTAFYFATSHKMCRKIGNRWMVDRVKADRVFDHLYKTEADHERADRN